MNLRCREQGAPPIIVGASIAGGLTALFLAAAEAPCVVLERRRRPHAKVCGEGIHPVGRTLLEAVLGPLGTCGETLRGFEFFLPEAAPLKWNFPDGEVGLGCDRLLLDQLIRRALQASPWVDFRAGVAVTGLDRHADRWRIHTTAGTLRTRHVVAADGVRSRLRDWAGLAHGSKRGRWGVRRRYRLKSTIPDRVQVHFCGDGEIYLTPLGGDRASIAILGEESLVRSLKDADGIEDYLRRSTFDLDRSPEDSPSMLPHRGSRTRALAKSGLFLAGDAACFLDPVSGAGMTLAALSGTLAARAVLEQSRGLPSQEVERRFSRRLTACTRPYRNLTRFLLAIGASSLLRRSAAPVLRRAPRLMSLLASPTLRSPFAPTALGPAIPDEATRP